MTTPETRTPIPAPGLTPQMFSRYLAGLGLIRVLAAQADPNLTAWWHGDVLMIDTPMIENGVPDLAQWLVEAYRPTPVISPWNGGSGFGVKDKASRAALDHLMTVESPRLAELQLAVRTAEPLVAQALERGWDKARLVSELRNVCPESLVRWLDACIVLRDESPAFPPLLGTGGNDGRLDFSTNFHQRLFDVLPELGAQSSKSRAWATDLLLGVASAPLVRAAVGQFDPGGAGGRNSSPFGAADSQVNPWEFVLLIEGALYFASGVARRQGAESSRAAMPFCVGGSADGPSPGADGEDSRGEIWAPVWNSPLRGREIAQLFAESRASWRGQIATHAAQMYAALRSFGVARGIDSFVRYGLHKRNGLAFSAVRLDQVAVRASSAIQLSVGPQRVADAYGRRVMARSVVAAHRRYRRHHMSFVAGLKAESLRDLLAELTIMDLTTMRSDRAREDLGWRPGPPAAQDFAHFLHNGLRDQAAFRVAATLAAGRTVTGDRPTSVRDLLIGVLPGSSRDPFLEAEVTGLGLRPLVEVLADLVRWRAQQEGDEVQRGFVPFARTGVSVPWSDLHHWVGGRINDHEVNQSFLACLALDWSQPGNISLSGPTVDKPTLPNLELALLQAMASGQVGSGSWRQVAELRKGGMGWAEARDEAGIARHGLERSWPARLLADTAHPGASSSVLVEAADALRRLGWAVAPPVRSALARDRLVAALVARASTQPLRQMGAQPPGQDERPPEGDGRIDQGDLEDLGEQ